MHVRHAPSVTALTFAVSLAAAGCAPAAAGGGITATEAVQPPSAPTPDASPAEVYQLLQDEYSRIEVEFDEADEKATRLRREDREAFERYVRELETRLNFARLEPFYTEAAIQELESFPQEEVQLVGTLARLAPSEYEVLDETIDGDRATLEVRGYLAEPMMGEPGWSTGTVQLVREDGSWQIVKESWGARE